MAPTPPTPAPPPRRVLRGAAPRKSCKARLLQSIPTEMPHLHRLPVVLSIGTDRLPPLYLPYSHSSSSSPRCGERRRPRAPQKSCKAWLLQSIPTEMPHLHRLPVVLSIAGVKKMVQLVVTLDDQSVPRGIFLVERGAGTRQGWWSMVKMAAKGSNGKEKLQCMDLSYDDSERSYKRSRQADSETTPEQQSAHGPLKIRDRKGWEHGTMIDGRHLEYLLLVVL